MGGDHGSEALVAGALLAVKEYGHQLILVGDSDLVQQALDSCREHGDVSGFDDSLVRVVHADEVVEMDESPLEAVRKKKNSSINIAFKLVKQGEADAVVSAGNSGATMAAAVKTLGRLKGVVRPGIAGIFPTLKRPVIMVDVGANVDCRPKHLFQFGVMGAEFSKLLLSMDEPRVGLLSIGEERGKGNDLVRKTHELLLASPLNYIGNVEGGDTFQGDVDVIVCDGFVGNICLKLSEGLAEAMVQMLRTEISKDLKAKVGYLLSKKAYARFKKRTDYAEYGGAPLLGLNGTAIISHGKSNSLAIKNAIRIAAEMVNSKFNDEILSVLAKSNGETPPQ